MRLSPIFAALATGASVAAAALPTAAALPPLIPRDVLFGSPQKTAPVISPDGKQLAYLAPSNGALAVWVRTIGAQDDRLVAADPKRPIGNVFWAPDGSRVLYLQDAGGNENYHLFAADPHGGATATDLTPYDKTRVQVEDVDPARPASILIGMNKRDPRVFDEYRLDFKSGKATLDTQNPGNVAGYASDVNGVVRAGLIQKADASSEIIVRDNGTAPWRTLATTTADDGPPTPVAFTPDGKKLLVVTSSNANAARLVSFDVATGSRADVTGDPQYDVGNVVISPKTHTPIAASIARDRVEWLVLDTSYKADFDALRAQVPGDIGVRSANADDSVWIVASTTDAASPSFWSYDRASKHAAKLFDTRPELAKYQLVPMRPITYTARDGMTIHGYLTTPIGVPATNLPAVLFVHGGPWGRDEWGYSGYAQWLANRGYVVLQPNFRGSTGYGKAFVNAGDRQWAGSMHTDLLDAKAWLVKAGIADPKRVAIMGGSYGGYATLAGLAFSPDAFAAGVDIVGPSNLNTLLASIPPYWETLRSTFTRRMGDTEAFLNAQSPLFKADAIRAPLLIGQGANDPRVNVRESDQIAAAMRKNKKPVTYVVFPDEGHGFARPENTKRFNAAVEAFLAQNLGGRAEPARPEESIQAFLK